MKHFSYAFSSGDVETLKFTLSILPLIDLEEVPPVQQEINNACCVSAMKKLLTHQPFSPNEIRVMALSLIIANMILKNELDVDSSMKSQCTSYIFSINHLLPIFSSAINL